jgi:uncharacterized membrane protein YqjE
VTETDTAAGFEVIEARLALAGTELANEVVRVFVNVEASLLAVIAFTFDRTSVPSLSILASTSADVAKRLPPL